jgi:hypothetical protein
MYIPYINMAETEAFSKTHLSDEPQVVELPDDNIADCTKEEIAAASQPAKIQDGVTAPPREETLFTITSACQKIALHYDRSFKNLQFIPSMQITDGCVAEFVDEEHHMTVASCRMRFLNRIRVDRNTAEMTVEVLLSDLSFVRAHLSLTVDKSNLK